MEADYFVGVAQQSLWILALAAAPILIPILVVGVLLGMVQAATSINEQTLSFVPKLIITAICSTLGSVLVLWFYGYLHIAKPEDSLLLAEFTMYKTQPGEDYKVSLTPAKEVAQCIDGVIVLFDTEQKGLSGVLVDNRKQAVRCVGEEAPQQVE